MDTSATKSSSSASVGKSNILQLNDGTIRQGHFLSLIGFSEPSVSSASQEQEDEGDRSVSRNFNGVDMYSQIAGFLAYKHLNGRSPTVLSDLPEQMSNCPDLQFTFEVRDTQYSPKVGVEQLVEATTPPPFQVVQPSTDAVNAAMRRVLQSNSTNTTQSMSDISNPTVGTSDTDASDGFSTVTNVETAADTTWQEPFAITCCYYSSVTIPVNTLSGAYEIPMASGSATSAALDDPTGGSLFSRTIPTNAGDALAAMAYYKSIDVAHVANIFIKDAWGSHYNLDLQRAAHVHNISLLSFPYDLKNPDSIETAVIQLKKSGYRYILSVFHSWEETLPIMYDHGLVGRSHPEYNLIAAEEFDWLWDGFEVKPDSYKVDAIDGVGVLQLHNDQHVPFEEAMTEFSQSRALQDEFLATIRDPVLRLAFNNYTFPAADFSAQKYMYYDAQIALGYAACATPGLFTGPELHANLLKIDFHGVTGHVQLDPRTGTRLPESVKFRLDNVVLADLPADAPRGQVRTFSNSLAVIMAGDNVTVHDPFVFADGTTTPPLPLPPLEFEYNLVPLGAQIFGLVLASLVIVVSLSLAGWTYKNRTAFVVKASQPIFLGQLCIGCIIMASAVFPMSLQGEESTSGLDYACMSIPWLLVLGFVTSITAISCKTWRLNKLMKSAQTMRRIQVEPRDAIRSFIVSMTMNVGLLIAWTIVAPIKYERITVQNSDTYGRDTESYGICVASSDKTYFFSIPVLIINFVTLALTQYQSYKARNFATEFSESYYLALALMSLAETLCLGVPILFVVADNPTASYLVKSGLTCIACVSILAPVFVPKFTKKSSTSNANNRGSARASLFMSRDFIDRQTGERNSHARSSASLQFVGAEAESGASVVEREEKTEEKVYGKMNIVRKNTHYY